MDKMKNYNEQLVCEDCGLVLELDIKNDILKCPSCGKENDWFEHSNTNV